MTDQSDDLYQQYWAASDAGNHDQAEEIMKQIVEETKALAAQSKIKIGRGIKHPWVRGTRW